MCVKAAYLRTCGMIDILNVGEIITTRCLTFSHVVANVQGSCSARETELLTQTLADVCVLNCLVPAQK